MKSTKLPRLRLAGMALAGTLAIVSGGLNATAQVVPTPHAPFPPNLAGLTHPDWDGIVFTGSTQTLTCGPTTPPNPIPATPPGCAGVPAVGGSGSYSFQENICVGHSGADAPTITEADISGNDVGTSHDEEVGHCTISSTGWYWNIVCGTGIAWGTATVSETGPAISLGTFPSDVYTVGYEIIFVGTTGVLVGAASESGTDGALEGSQLVVGLVNIHAVPNIPPTPTCTASFDVAGVAVTTI